MPAGGSFNHRGHVAFDRHNHRLLSNFFVRMLQQLGIEANTFGDGVISVVWRDGPSLAARLGVVRSEEIAGRAPR